jgi:hypothetical protein
MFGRRQQLQQRRVGLLGRRGPLDPGAPGRGREPVQVLALGCLEAEGGGDRLDDLRGGVAGLALLEPGVVRGTDPGQQR